MLGGQTSPALGLGGVGVRGGLEVRVSVTTQ